jgi:membrane dipeptidase
VPDDVLRRLPDNGGVCMITFVPSFVSPEVVEWDHQLRAAMTEAGVKHSDLEERGAFADKWDGPPRPKADLSAVVAHVEHAREVAGIDHIGIGGDYDGVGELPAGLEDVSSYPNLFAALLDRGWTDEDCAKLAGENVLRALSAAEEYAAKQ